LRFPLISSLFATQNPTPIPAITILLLEAAVEEKISLAEALAADVIVAGIIAVIAFHWGTLGSPYSLALPSVWRLMLGQTPSGGTWQLGSFFWLIHTTFLPTAIYFSLIFLASCAAA
jgi:hypothetical protein